MMDIWDTMLIVHAVVCWWRCLMNTLCYCHSAAIVCCDWMNHHHLLCHMPCCSFCQLMMSFQWQCVCFCDCLDELGLFMLMYELPYQCHIDMGFLLEACFIIDATKTILLAWFCLLVNDVMMLVMVGAWMLKPCCYCPAANSKTCCCCCLFCLIWWTWCYTRLIW